MEAIQKKPIETKSMLKNISAGVRLVLFGKTVLAYFVTAVPFYAFMKPFPFGTRRILNRFLKFYSTLGCKILVIDPKHRLEELKERDNFLIVANHLSYTDVLAICSELPACFVTSVEIRDTPFLGHICKLGGCLFVERRSRQNLSKEIKEITDALENGLNVCIFPEATSTNGAEVLRFKRPLFKAAIESGKKVLPLTLNYTQIGTDKVDISNRDKVCWYGDMTFFPHLWGVLGSGKIDVDVHASEPIETHPELDMTELSVEAHRRVSSKLRPFKTAIP
jgi:1-acyl-sn-glycerol-3-phosphate acyltransferase